MLVKNLKNVLNSGDVVRFHNHAGIDKQKNSEHQWGVALIVNYLDPAAPKGLILAALTHDAAEYYTGDLSFAAKQTHPELRTALKKIERKWEEANGIAYNLGSSERLTLKLADVLEGLWFCVAQIRVGHSNANRPFRKWRAFLQDKTSNWPARGEEGVRTRALTMLAEIDRRYVEAGGKWQLTTHK